MIKPVKTANVISAITARSQFGQIMRRASQKNERFLVDRRGEPAVIIMSVKDYIDNTADPGFIEEPDYGGEAERAE